MHGRTIIQVLLYEQVLSHSGGAKSLLHYYYSYIMVLPLFHTFQTPMEAMFSHYYECLYVYVFHSIQTVLT